MELLGSFKGLGGNRTVLAVEAEGGAMRGSVKNTSGLAVARSN